MSTTARTRMYRLVLAAIVLAAALSSFLWPSPSANAVIIEGPFVCIYYSNSQFTTVVGARGTGCCGEPINWGIITPYKRCEELLCPDVLCPN